MNFEPADLVFLGGELLLGPISSRCLLIRLHDLNSSFLVCHDSGKEVTSSATRFGRIPEPTTSIETSVSVHDAKSLNIHGPASAEASLDELLSMKPVVVSLPSGGRSSLPRGTVVAANKFGPIDIWVAAGNSPGGKMHVIFGRPAERWSTYQIEGLDWELRCSEEMTIVGRDAQFPVWRLAVLADGVEMTWRSTADWDVSGFVVDSSWSVTGEIRMQRSSSECPT
jgi:hypothetical protein